MYERVKLSSSAAAVMIPSGEPVTLEEGTEATVTQSLGGSFTLVTDRGIMVRLSGREVAAIGKEPVETPQIEGDVNKENLEKLVWDQLRTCYDPEIPVNIVDLGLVYLCEVEPAGEGEGTWKARIKMTLTAPGCGMGPVLAGDVRIKLLAIPGIRDANVEVVFDPVWDRAMMSEAARLQLGMMW
ncbi:MAG: putative Fe-S cluster assembly protein SufT [Thermoanaerobaculia bacterium]|jgi:probable FeS assembly SUF system protein SufT